MNNPIARIAAAAEGVYGSLEGFGGFLRCETCRKVTPMQSGDSGQYLRHGWPRCCGYTMKWWTQRQINDGEVPA